MKNVWILTFLEITKYSNKDHLGSGATTSWTSLSIKPVDFNQSFKGLKSVFATHVLSQYIPFWATSYRQGMALVKQRWGMSVHLQPKILHWPGIIGSTTFGKSHYAIFYGISFKAMIRLNLSGEMTILSLIPLTGVQSASLTHFQQSYYWILLAHGARLNTHCEETSLQLHPKS